MTRDVDRMRSTGPWLLAALAMAGTAHAQAPEAGFVNMTGRSPAVQATPAEGAGDASIERLLTRPADLWERLRQGFAMPDLDARQVGAHEKWYAARPELLRAILARGRRYLHYIVEEVERRGLPMELALLPAVESGFNPAALSSAQASGLWQFIPSTGTRFGLEQNERFDARRDVPASTSAALEYLAALYALQRDWHLALASYNWGENAVLRARAQARARGRPELFEHLLLPEETRNYVPKLLALRNIVMDPERFGLDLGELADEPYFASVPLEAELDLRAAARLAQMPYEDLLALNPGYRRDGRVLTLVVPLDREPVLRENLVRHRESPVPPPR